MKRRDLAKSGVAAGTAFAMAVAGAMSACGTGQVPEAPADVVLINGKVFPADGSGVFYEALAIRGNTIAAVGQNAEIERFRGPDTQVVDAAGHAVVPGFNDNHVHLLSGGRGLETLDLQGVATLADVQEKIRTFAKAHAESAWVEGRGWNYTAFPGYLPTRQQLDAVVPDRPAVMRCFDGHTTWVNSKALALAGIDANTPDPPGGTIVRDPTTKAPTGVLKEGPAMALVNRVMPRQTPDDQQRALRAATTEAHRNGVTSLTEASGSLQGLAFLDEARRSGQLALRVHYALRVNPGFSEQDAEQFDAAWRQQPDTPLLRTGIVKMMLDGVASTHTAFMLAPYTNRPSPGTTFFPRDEFERIVRLLDGRGWQIMVHALGDGAVRMGLDAFERAAAANAAPARGRRHRLEHVSYMHPTDAQRFSTLGVIAAFQGGGGFVPPNAPPPSTASPTVVNVGVERWAAHGGLVKDVVDSGGRLTLGSDWPVAPFNPMGRVTGMVNRPVRPGGRDQRIPLPVALEAYSREAAWASFQESRVGSLRAGMLADIVVLATDIFSRSPTNPDDVAVVLTIFDGKVVYRRT
jgi:predicted amidohydrolase YtcJ